MSLLSAHFSQYSGTVIGTATGGSKAQSPAQSLRSHSSSDCHKLQRAFSASRTSLLETDHHPAPRSAPMWRSSSYSCLSARSVAGSPAPTSIRPPRRSLHPSSSDRVAPTPPLAPCSTTTLDFHRHPNQSPRAPRTWRCGTPRGNNPHPVGLVFQSPYNQHNKVTVSYLVTCAAYKILILYLIQNHVIVLRWGIVIYRLAILLTARNLIIANHCL